VTDKQFRAVAHSLLDQINNAPGYDNASFLAGALMAMFDIGASSSAREDLRPDGKGRKLVNDIAGRF
jgi:hypothetical protein